LTLDPFYFAFHLSGRTAMNELLRAVEKASQKSEMPQFGVGDTLDVHVRIVEGDKERIQIFTGTCIAREHGGSRENFTVRRIVQGEGVERKFPIHCPNVTKIEVKRSGRVRRAKLFYLRKRMGKATRLQERRGRGRTVVEVEGQEEE
jgi:large subunit ribosomal protein L19